MNALRDLFKISLIPSMLLVAPACAKSGTGKSGPNLKSDANAISMLISSHQSEIDADLVELTDKMKDLNKGVPIVDAYGNNYFVAIFPKRDVIIVVALGKDAKLGTEDDESIVIARYKK